MIEEIDIRNNVRPTETLNIGKSILLLPESRPSHRRRVADHQNQGNSILTA